MARFKTQLPDELIREVQRLEKDATKMIEEMTQAGAEVVVNNVKANIQSSFKDAHKLLPYLKVTRTYITPTDNAINTKVGFYGYYKEKTFTVRNKKNGDIYQYTGIPVPLIVRAREYGSSSGEQKKPFFRKSFNKQQIENAMLQIQKKYIKED